MGAIGDEVQAPERVALNTSKCRKREAAEEGEGKTYNEEGEGGLMETN